MHYQFKFGEEMTCKNLDMATTKHLLQKLTFSSIYYSGLKFSIQVCSQIFMEASLVKIGQE